MIDAEERPYHLEFLRPFLQGYQEILLVLLELLLRKVHLSQFKFDGSHLLQMLQVYL
jgi:hypothetical protein